MLNTRRVGALFIVAAAINPAASRADESVSSFYHNRIIRLVVGFPAGGVNDIVARHVARLLPGQLPGAPRVVVQNMPGAGSMKAVEFLSVQAPRDGTVIGAISTSVIMQSIMGPGDDLVSRLEWLGSAEAVTRVCFAYAKTGITDIEAIRTRGVIVGATSVGSPTSDHARLLKRALGESVRIVHGYSGNPDLALAMERGEIEAVCGNSIQTIKIERPEWYAQSRLNFLIRFSDEPRGEAAKLPSFISLLAPGEREAAAFLVRQDSFARAFAIPAGVPAGRLAAFRAAFDSTLDSPEFEAEMSRAGVVHSPLRGEEMAVMVEEMRAADPKLKERARRLLSEP